GLGRSRSIGIQRCSDGHHCSQAGRARTPQSSDELAHVARVTTLGELTASIAHEVNQPLSGIMTRASAALRWLSGESPNVEKARETLRQIVEATHRASDVVGSVRAMFNKDTLDKSAVDINKLINSVLSLVYFDLRQKHSRARFETYAASAQRFGSIVTQA